ncbi:hypothetical protein WQ57_18375 [Mesobacillus campisalis]|uniref:ATP-grasp domain-containing protein n=1 Tax=Mesobacillus campisalis TaxID=1408103 RepID=A0A0M2SSE2_9BACI|nr:ATP-grasp domain-containing protein [Mesobacillus campisalis]KKK36616.1 hypothetical protein WQ57_18375 [Mesobacillus campisalis]
MNILICSAGRRVKLVQYFKEELNKLNGKVIAVDCDPTAAALHHADHYEVVPRINQPEYIDCLKALCNKYKINAVLSLIDPELALLAGYKEEFESAGVKVIISNRDVVNVCFDKYLTYQFLRDHQIPAVPTYTEIQEVLKDLENGDIDFPLIVKPQTGSASIGIHKVDSLNELRRYEAEQNNFIIQPFISGEEYGVDCYIDMVKSEATHIFMKRKITMRAGETDKSISVNDPALKQLIEKLVLALKPVGPIDIDCFKTEEGYLVSEINPRFGGGYLHAHEMGFNFVMSIITNLQGKPNDTKINDYKEGTTLVKFDNVILF